jgi:N-methylhydantoinase A
VLRPAFSTIIPESNDYTVVLMNSSGGSRAIHFLDFGEVNTPVYDRFALAPGASIRGPAVFGERHSSCAFGRDCVITVDESFNLAAEIGLAAEPR